MPFNDVSPAYGDALYIMLGLLALFLVLLVIYLWRTGWGRRGQGETFTLRPIPGYEATHQGLSRAAETGRAVHTSPGTGGVGARGTSTASTLAGMALVESMARVSAITGAPVQATTNDAVVFALTDNAIRRGYQRAGWTMEEESGARFLTHDDPIAYVAGAAEVVHQQKVTQSVISGQFGPEVLFLIEAQRRAGAQQIAGSSDPQAIALMAITTDYTLIGEEIFASGAYLERRATHIASLLAQDGLRWVVIAAIIIGFILVNTFGQDWTQLLTLYPR